MKDLYNNSLFSWCARQVYTSLWSERCMWNIEKKIKIAIEFHIEVKLS